MTSKHPGSGPGSPAADEPKARGSRSRMALEWVVVITGALFLTLFIQATSLQAFRIPSESMLPTLEKGDRVLVNKWSYRLHDVNRGDLVVFGRPPGLADTSVDDLIKRVVGLPGETVTIVDGHVLIDGEPLDEPYVDPGVPTLPSGPISCAPENPCVIPDGQVWVMGDNRTNSEDSRFFGPIEESTIVGRAFVKIWPPTRLGGL